MPLPANTSAYLTGAALLFSLFANIKNWLQTRYELRRKRDVAFVFVTDMATVHLPYIYESLQAVCRKLGTDSIEPPPIQFVQFKEQGNAAAVETRH